MTKVAPSPINSLNGSLTAWEKRVRAPLASWLVSGPKVDIVCPRLCCEKKRMESDETRSNRVVIMSVQPRSDAEARR